MIESPTGTSGQVDPNTTFTRSPVLPLPEWKTGKSSPDERQIFCNPFAGWLDSSYDETKQMTMGRISVAVQQKGGILAEIMGLGKTVEVIACILANPCPVSLQSFNSSAQTLQSSNSSAQIQAESNAISPNNVDGGSNSSNSTQIPIDQKIQHIAANIKTKQLRATKPSAIRDAVCICGRSAPYNGCALMGCMRRMW